MFLFFRHVEARTRSSSCAPSAGASKVPAASVSKYLLLLRRRCSGGAVPERVLYGLHQVSHGNKTKKKAMVSKDIFTMFCYFRGDQSEGGRTEAAEWLPYEAVYDSNNNNQLK